MKPSRKMIWKNPDSCESVRKMGIDLENPDTLSCFLLHRRKTFKTRKNFRLAMLPMFLALWCKAALIILAMFNVGMIFCLCCIDVTLSFSKS